MANQITGTVILIGQTYQVPTNNGTQFVKRELVLDASTFDRYTGQKRENYVNMEFVQNNCAKLDNFNEGDLVTVDFVLSGRKSEKDGQVRYFTNITGYDIRLFQNGGNQGPQQAQSAAPSQSPAPAPQTSQQGANGGNTGQSPYPPQQPFPPAVDENGNPINPNDDLPF